jgi:cryptochrome
MAMAAEEKIEVMCTVGHTLCDPEHLIKEAKGKPTTAYASFCTHFNNVVKKHPIVVAPTVETMPALRMGTYQDGVHGVPTLEQLGYDASLATSPMLGGEKEALARLDKYMARTKWVAEFEKPNTSPAIADMDERSTTVLSPYLKFGCLSSRRFYLALKDVYKKSDKYSKPPVSLEGQLLWREVTCSMCARVRGPELRMRKCTCRWRVSCCDDKVAGVCM